MATILIADDRPINRQYLVTLLGHFGHRLIEASDGEEALQLALAEHPQLVITDMVMPRLDGEELACRLRSEPSTADIPVMFYSAAYSLPQAEAVARNVGAFGVLPKPAEPQLILRLVHNALRLPAPASLQALESTAAFPVPPLAAKLPRQLKALEAISHRLAALIEMSLELASERDPERLLQGFAQMARKLLGAKYALVGALAEDGKTLLNILGSGGSGVGGSAAGSAGEWGATTAGVSQGAALSPGSVLRRLVEDRRPLRLANVKVENLGLHSPLLMPGGRTTAVLAVAVQSPSRLHGWLCLIEKLGGQDFTEQDERVAATLANHVAVAYERVTERKQAEEALSRSQRVLESLFEYAPDAIAATDQEGRIVRVNARLEEQFGYRREELLGQTVEVLVPDRFREVHPAHRKLYQADPRPRSMGSRLDLYARRKDGTEFSVDITLSAIETSDNRLVLSVIRDLTHRKQAEERIRELNQDLEDRVKQLEVANQSLEAFNFSVSHDLRVPLRAISGFVRIILEDHSAQLDAEAVRMLDVVARSAVKMGQLTDGLLALSRLGPKAPTMSKIDMEDLARSTIDELRQSDPCRQVELTFMSLPPAIGDPAMIRQVYANLISNAWKFTRNTQQAVIEIGARQNGKEVIYYVKDNGAGFDMKDAGKLFGVLQRLHRDDEFEGTGVGLATVQRIIQKHGGRIWAESETAKGAAFYFTLPASPPAGG